MKFKVLAFIVGVLVLFSAVRSSVVDWISVSSQNMLPNLYAGETVWVNRLAYDVRLPWLGSSIFKTSPIQRGDVVLYAITDNSGEKIFSFGRVIGLSGDKLVAIGNSMSINGENIDRHRSESQDLLKNLNNELSLFGRAENYELFTEVINKNKYQVLNLKEQSILMTPVGKVSHQVAEGNVYLLGDNRDNSNDSRYKGDVQISDIWGKVFSR